jgi:hypothetical protein
MSDHPTGPVPTVRDASQPALPGQAARAEIPPGQLWQWIWSGIRPVLGWVSLGVGVILLIVGWYEVAGTSVVAKQMPYIASCGLGGVAFVVFGARWLMIQDLRRDSGRLDRLETMVSELHAVLLARGGVTGAAAAPVAAAGSNGAPGYVVLPQGSTYHLADCPVVQGKERASVQKPAMIAKRGLAPCPLCEPPAVSAPASAPSTARA